MAKKQAAAPGFPKTVGACIDRMYELREEKAGYAAQERVADAAYKALQKHLLDTYQQADLTGARGALAQCNLNPDVVPTVEDWDQVYGWIAAPVLTTKSKMPDAQRKEIVEVIKQRCAILQRRISPELWRALLDQMTPVPGTKAFPVTKVSLTAIRQTKGRQRGQAKA